MQKDLVKLMFDPDKYMDKFKPPKLGYISQKSRDKARKRRKRRKSK